MLKELSQVRQIPEEPQRRWFADDYFDLIVWFGKAGQILGFQLCYDLEGEERALTWRQRRGYSHQAVDSGDLQRPFKASPILVADGAFDQAAILQRFQERSGAMDTRIARFVADKIRDYHVSGRNRGRTEGL